MAVFDRSMEADLRALREGEACPDVRPRKSLLTDFFRTHFIEYAFLLLYVSLSAVVMLTFVHREVAHVWKVLNDDLSVATDKFVR